MSDEAFARRFYSDRAELLALGVPLHSQRDEFTGEELYNTALGALLPAAARARPTTSSRRCRPASTCSRDSSPTPSRCGSRSRTSRSAAPASPRRRPRPPCASRCSTPTTRRRCRAGSASSRARSRSSARSSSATGRSRATSERERTVNPYALFQDDGAWYVVGHDLDAEDERTFRVSRIRGEIRFATRRERDFRLPAELRRRPLPRPPAVADRRDRRRGADRGRAATPPGGSSARYGDRGRIEDGVFVTEYSSLPLLAPGCCARTAARCRRAPDELRREVARGAAARARAPRGRAGRARRRDATVASRRTATARPRRSRPSASASCRHCSRTCSTAAARRRAGRVPGAGARRALQHPARVARGAPLAAQPRQLRRRLLRRLRRARRRHDPRRQGALRRHVPGAAAADAARGAGDPARARVRRADDRRRRALAARARAREARGDLRRVRARADARAARAARRGRPRRHAQPGHPRAATRRDRVPEGRRGGRLDAPGRAVLARAPAAVLVRAHVGPHARRRSARSGSTGCAAHGCSAGTSSRARASTRTSSATPARRASGTRSEIARWEVEKGARAARRTASAVAERPVGSPEWLVGEILSLPRRGGRARADGAAPARSPRGRRRSSASWASARVRVG